MPDAEGEARP